MIVKVGVEAPTPPLPPNALANYNFISTGWTNQLAITAEQGDVPSGLGLQIGGLQTQTTIKRTWPDGSLKHAILKANVINVGNANITIANNLGGSFTPASWPTASVAFIIGSDIYIAVLGSVDVTDTWENGPLCRSARKKVIPMNGATPHPQLVVWFDISSYNPTGHIVDISVNNVHDKTTGDQVTYDVSVVINGLTRYTKLAHNQKYLTRPRLGPFAVDLIESTYQPDFTPFYATKALPEFSSLTSFTPVPTGPVGLPEFNNDFTGSQFDIGEFGGMLPFMGEAGWRPEISTPYPDPLPRWLIHKNQGSFSLIKKWADLSASWSGHILNEDDTFITTTQYSHYWLDKAGRSGAWPLGPKAVISNVTIRGTGELFENAHIPQIVYPAYVLTGDRYYADQLAFWAAAIPLLVWPGADTWYGHRVPNNIMIGDQIRGLARGLMTVEDAAAYLPDGHQLITYLTNTIINNVNFLDADCAFRSGGPFSSPSYWIIKNNPGAFHPDWQHTIPWTDNFVTLMVWKALRHGLITTQGNTYLLRTGNMWKNLFGTPGWPLEAAFAAPYAPLLIPAAPGPTNFDDPYNTTSRQYSTDIPAMVAAMGGPGNPSAQFANYYGVDARQGLMIGQTLGIDTSAQLTYLLAQPGMLDDLAFRSGHYIINV